jgi:hypothetical protein
VEDHERAAKVQVTLADGRHFQSGGSQKRSKDIATELRMMLFVEILVFSREKCS